VIALPGTTCTATPPAGTPEGSCCVVPAHKKKGHPGEHLFAVAVDAAKASEVSSLLAEATVCPQDDCGHRTCTAVRAARALLS
jgi:hypothetical protein